MTGAGFAVPQELELPDGRIARVERIRGNRAQLSVDDDTWEYDDAKAAVAALHCWTGEGEPDGWNIHPASGRVRRAAGTGASARAAIASLALVVGACGPLACEEIAWECGRNRELREVTRADGLEVATPETDRCRWLRLRIEGEASDGG